MFDYFNDLVISVWRIWSHKDVRDTDREGDLLRRLRSFKSDRCLSSINSNVAKK